MQYSFELNLNNLNEVVQFEIGENFTVVCIDRCKGKVFIRPLDLLAHPGISCIKEPHGFDYGDEDCD